MKRARAPLEEPGSRWARHRGTFKDLMTDKQANDTLCEFVREKIRGKVAKPEVVDKLLPYDYPIFTKRALRRHRVFRDVQKPRDGHPCRPARRRSRPSRRPDPRRRKDYDLTSWFLAIGFDAMTAPMTRSTSAAAGQEAQACLGRGSDQHLGLMVARLSQHVHDHRAGQPLVLGNTMGAIEHNVGCSPMPSRHIGERQLSATEPDETAEKEWMAEVHAPPARTLYPETKSWYNGDNVRANREPSRSISAAGKVPRPLRRVLREWLAGFALSSTPAPVPEDSLKNAVTSVPAAASAEAAAHFQAAFAFETDVGTPRALASGDPGFVLLDCAARRCSPRVRARRESICRTRKIIKSRMSEWPPETCS